MNFKKFIPFCLTVLALGLASCGDDTTSSTGEQAHQHTYATEWSKDSTHHWHPCTGTDCGVYKDRAAHHGGEATCTTAAVCEDCGESYGSLKAHTFDQEVADAKYLKAEATHAAKATYFKSCTCGEKGTETFEHGTTVEHTKAESWSKDATNHWKGCTATGCENIKLDSAAHVYDQEVVHADYLKDAATCLADAVYFKSCVCGAKGETTFTAANSKLAHDYDLTTYGLKTSEGHAHVCKTEGCNAHDTVVAHSTTEGTCEACGYVSHTHVWQETLTVGTDTHWIKCNSCDEKKPESEVAHTYENQGTTVTQNKDCELPELTKKTCDCGAEHASETWESAPAEGHDETGAWVNGGETHYKVCGKTDCGKHILVANHVEGTAATCHSLAICSVCEFTYGQMKTHTFGQDFVTNEFGHWHVCSADDCEETSGYANHTFNPKDNKCLGCNETLTPTYATKTIAELAALTAKESTVYKVTGVVNGIYGPEYGNFYLIDPETGAEILVYGLAGMDKDLMKCTISNTGKVTSDYSSSGKNFEATGVKDGDKITILATVGAYNNKSQLIAVLQENHGTYEGAAKTLTTSFDESRGSVVLSTTTANIGDTVTVTVTPTGDYVVASVKVYNGCDAKNYGRTGTTLNETAPGVYTFTADLLNNVEVVFSAGPATISTKSITELSKLTAKDNTVVEVIGVVQGTYNTQFGNLYLLDLENGNKILVYGLANKDALTMTDSGEGYFTGTYNNNKTFSSLGVKDGDVIKVNAIVDVYNGAAQLNAVLVEKLSTWESGDFDVTVNATENGSVVPSVETAKYGETVTLTVTPAEGYKVLKVLVNKGLFGTSEVTANDGVYSFNAGFKNEITVTFVSENEEIKTLKALKSLDELVDGVYYIGYSTLYLGSYGTNFFSATTDSTNAIPVTFKKTTSGWTMQFNNNYICKTNSQNQVQKTTTINNTCYWTITFEDGTFKIKSTNKTDYYLQCNANSGQERFSCYKNTQKHLTLYVLE